MSNRSLVKKGLSQIPTEYLTDLIDGIKNGEKLLLDGGIREGGLF